MAEFVAFEPGIEVNGQTIYAVVDGMGAFKNTALQILADNGIVDPEPDRWYSQQAWLDAFRTISERIGNSTLFSIGKKIPENADFPEDIDTIAKALAAIDVAYHMNHRKDGHVMFDPETGSMLEGIGHYGEPDVGDREAVMVCENPYPSEFDRGIIHAMARRFRPADATVVTVERDESAPTRQRGADSCTYRISW